MTPSAARPLRADAERNRRLILDVAREVFAEHGLEGSFDEIARRAGVGVGTVYRRFPERDDLVDALFAERMDEMVALALAATERPDAWEGFAWFLERSVEAQALDVGLREALGDGLRGSERMTVARDRMRPAISALVARVHATGELRADIEPLDIAMLTVALCALSPASNPDLWRRYLVVVLDGLRAGDPSPLRTPAPTEDEVGTVVHPGVRRRR